MRLSKMARRYMSEKYRIRRGFRNRPILQVWVEYPNVDCHEWLDIKDYRDAPTLLQYIDGFNDSNGDKSHD